MFSLFVALTLWTLQFSIAEDATEGPRLECPIGWVMYDGFCYLYFDEIVTGEDATSYCYNVTHGAGDLVSIQSLEENQIVSDLVSFYNVGAWIGIRRFGSTWHYVSDNTTVKFTNWFEFEPRNMKEYNCVQSNEYGFWETANCEEGHPVICEMPATKQTASATYYCLRSESEENMLVFFVDSRGNQYREVSLVDDDDTALPGCDWNAVGERRGDHFALVLISEAGTCHPNCTASEGDNDTCTSYVRFRESHGVYSVGDVTFEATCNFTDTDFFEGIVDLTDLSAWEDFEKLKPANKEDLGVSISFLDDRGEVVPHPSLGQNVTMRLEVGAFPDNDIYCMYPTNCYASSSSNATTDKVQLSDDDGCPTENSPLPALKTSDHSPYVFTTDSFAMFRLGDETMELACKLSLRRRDGQTCTDLCSAVHGDRRGLRRSVNDIGNHRDFSAIIQLS